MKKLPELIRNDSMKKCGRIEGCLGVRGGWRLAREARTELPPPFERERGRALRIAADARCADRSTRLTHTTPPIYQHARCATHRPARPVEVSANAFRYATALYRHPSCGLQ